MIVLRRPWLLALLAIPPPLMIALLCVADRPLHAANRIIDPEILWYAAALELPVFFVFAVPEARNRW